MSEWQRLHDESIEKQTAELNAAIAQMSGARRWLLGSFGALGTAAHLAVLPLGMVFGVLALIDGSLQGALLGFAMLAIASFSSFRAWEMLRTRRQTHANCLTGLPARKFGA